MTKFILCLLMVLVATEAQPQKARRTVVSISGNQFYINGKLTYEGRYWNGHKIEGLLMNARMVQGIFDDENPETRPLFVYPDTKKWDPERNTREFVKAMKLWRAHGLLAFTLNLQGGSPVGYGNRGWRNSAFDEGGNLKKEYLVRLEKILDRADALGMVVMLGYFYFGQDEVLKDEAAVVNAVDGITRWILTKGYQNILIEVNNESNVRYDHEILKPDRVHELIERVKGTTVDNHRLLAGTSYGGGKIPLPNVVAVSDFLLLHGNGVDDPSRISEMVALTKQVAGYRGQPILFNEDDHFDFDKPINNFVAAVTAYASWGYFDYRKEGEPFAQGYQTVPVDWGINSERKRAFFNLVKTITGE